MSDEQQPLSLLEWLQKNTDLTSLDELSLASGVDLPSLTKINAGEATPSPHHVKALRRIFSGIPAEVLKRHTISVPDHISTRRGTLPEGTELHIGTVSDLRVGDYVPYVPARGQSTTFGSHWVQVRSLVPQGITKTIIDFGGIVRPFSPELSIRFARNAI